MRFTIDGNPKGKQRPRWGKGNRMYTPKETTDYEEKVADACLREMKRLDLVQVPPDQPMSIEVKAWMPIPTSWSKKKQQRAVLGLESATTKPDADNILKIICDGVQGTYVADDKQFTRTKCDKAYSTEPRVDVEILEVK